MADVSEVVEALKHIREAKGFSQRAVAATMGIEQGNFSRMERGANMASVDTLRRWAGALGYEIEIHLKKADE